MMASAGVERPNAWNNMCYDLITCSICVGTLRQPKALQCLHVFCLDCLEKWRLQEQQSPNYIVCPECRKETKFEGSKGVAGLPDDFRTKSFAEALSHMQALAPDHPLLEERKNELRKCFDEVEAKSKKLGEEIDKYDAVAAEARDQMKEDIDEHTKQIIGKLEADAERMKADVDKHFESLLQTNVRKEAKSLKQKFGSLLGDIFETLEGPVHGVINGCRDLFERASNLGKIYSRSGIGNAKPFTDIQFQPSKIDTSIGQLLNSGSPITSSSIHELNPVPIKELDGGPFAFDPVGGNLVVFSPPSRKPCRVSTYDTQGNLIREDEDCDLNGAFNVAISSSVMAVIIANTKRVVVFEREYGCSIDYSDIGDPNIIVEKKHVCGLSASNNYIVVADPSKRLVSVYTHYGELVTDIEGSPRLGQWCYVFITENNIIFISDRGNKCIQSFDVFGTQREVFECVDEGGNAFKPHGLAIDPWGYMNVVDCDNNRILKRGDEYFMTWIDGKDGIHNPKSIAFNATGQFAVQKAGSKVQLFDLQ